jgi:hypothetical protein
MFIDSHATESIWPDYGRKLSLEFQLQALHSDP